MSLVCRKLRGCYGCWTADSFVTVIDLLFTDLGMNAENTLWIMVGWSGIYTDCYGLHFLSSTATTTTSIRTTTGTTTSRTSTRTTRTSSHPQATRPETTRIPHQFSSQRAASNHPKLHINLSIPTASYQLLHTKLPPTVKMCLDFTKYYSNGFFRKEFHWPSNACRDKCGD